MPKFTVILLYPDYATDNYGETWCGSVEAANAFEAVGVAQNQVIKDNQQIEFNDPDDLLPVSVFAGEHDDLVGQWAEAKNAQNQAG